MHGRKDAEPDWISRKLLKVLSVVRISHLFAWTFSVLNRNIQNARITGVKRALQIYAKTHLNCCRNKSGLVRQDGIIIIRGD